MKLKRRKSVEVKPLLKASPILNYESFHCQRLSGIIFLSQIWYGELNSFLLKAQAYTFTVVALDTKNDY